MTGYFGDDYDDDGNLIEPDESAEQGSRLVVHPAGSNPSDTARKIASHLRQRNSPASLFRMGNAAVLLLPDGILEPFDTDAWAAYILQRVNFTGQKGDLLSTPSTLVLRIAAKLLVRELPPLDGVISTPYLTADGHLITEDGYNAETRLVLRMGDLKMPYVPDEPTPDEVAAAVRLLRWEWLGDFPFATEADAVNAIAELLTIIGREMFALAPLLVHDASTAGSGKGLLLDVVSIVASGKPAHITELPADKEEQRKTILSVLLSGQLLVAWDELHVIEGTSLAAILTAENYTARVLGISKMVEVRNKLVQVALGNNVEVRGDMQRRVSPLRLQPDTAHPEQRSNWRHSDLKEWTAEHRGELLAAAFTLWRNWIAKGRPTANVTMGSFDKWARTIGGVLEAAGTPHFMSNKSAWLTFSEDDSDDWYSHLRALSIYFQERWFTARQAADGVDAGRLPRPPVKVDPEKELHSLIPYGYRKIRDRWHGEYRLIRSTERDSEAGTYTWRVEHHPALSESAKPSPVSTGSAYLRKRTVDAGDAVSGAWTSTVAAEASTVPKPPLTCGTVDAVDAVDGFPVSHSAGPTPNATVTDSDCGGWPTGSIGAAANSPRPTPLNMPHNRHRSERNLP